MVTEGRALAFGHRGGMGLEPENTLAAFRRALELGVDGVELDVHLTSDGAVVVMHDEEVDRTTDGTGRIHEKTLRELRRLDAAARHGEGHSVERIPSLRDVLELVGNRARVQIEIKREAPWALAPALEIVRETGHEDRCAILSFSDAAVREAKALAPRIRAELIYVIPFRPIARALEARADGFNLSDVFVTGGLVRRAHAAGLTVGTGIVNHPPQMRRLLKAGVDAIYSDRPDILVPIVRGQGSGVRGQGLGVRGGEGWEVRRG